MATAVDIRPLAKGDDRTQFSCGQPDLDRFFEHYAGQNQFKLHLSVTYVATLHARIVGFATVSPTTIERETDTAELLKPARKKTTKKGAEETTKPTGKKTTRRKKSP